MQAAVGSKKPGVALTLHSVEATSQLRLYYAISVPIDPSAMGTARAASYEDKTILGVLLESVIEWGRSIVQEVRACGVVWLIFSVFFCFLATFSLELYEWGLAIHLEKTAKGAVDQGERRNRGKREKEATAEVTITSTRKVSIVQENESP